MNAARRKAVVAFLVTLLTVGVIGAASAYWAASGSGTGSGTSGDIIAVTLSPATTSSQVFPGGQAGVAVLVTNPNPGPVRVVSLVLDTTRGTGGFAVDEAHAACGVDALSYTAQNNGGAGWSISGGGSYSLLLPNALSMSTGAANACQGASFTVYLRATL